MAASVEALCVKARCSICHGSLKDPVTILECGHIFCRYCLVQRWGESQAEASCPECRKRRQQRIFIPSQQEQSRAKVCEWHNQPLKLFCKVEEDPICVACHVSNEHEHHAVVPLQEAFEEHKGMICSSLEIGKREKETILALQADLQKDSQEVLKLTRTEKEQTMEKVRELCKFLKEQERSHLTRIEEVEKETRSRRDEELASLSRDLSSLELIILKMEQTLRAPAIKLLQDARTTLQNYEQRKRPENPLPFLSNLKHRISKFCSLNPIVEHAMDQLKEALLLREQQNKAYSNDLQQGKFGNLQQADITLDPNTAHCTLIVSEYLKSVRCGKELQDVPDNPERFRVWPCVLGREGFTGGRYFWDVNVERGRMWIVGVARKSVNRHTSHELYSENSVWGIGKWGGEYLASTYPDYSSLSLIWEPRKIRVTLDYEDGRVSFSDADSAAELYTFSGVSFSGETLFPYLLLSGIGSQLSVS